jgi:hypothetical protein
MQIPPRYITAALVLSTARRQGIGCLRLFTYMSVIFTYELSVFFREDFWGKLTIDS